jgi:hypothetical protein
VEDLLRQGLSNRAVAKELTAMGITTPRGGKWSAQAVINLRRRLGLHAVDGDVVCKLPNFAYRQAPNFE